MPALQDYVLLAAAVYNDNKTEGVNTVNPPQGWIKLPLAESGMTKLYLPVASPPMPVKTETTSSSLLVLRSTRWSSKIAFASEEACNQNTDEFYLCSQTIYSSEQSIYPS